MADQLRMKLLRGRYKLPAAEETTSTVVTPDLSRYRTRSEVGSSFLAKDELLAAPIPVTPIPHGELRPVSEEELKELLKKPLSVQVREAIAMLGGVDYFVRVGLYDHKTLLNLAAKLEPKELQLGPSESLYDLLLKSVRIKTLDDVEVVNG